MDPTTAALSVAAATGLAAYVNGKYHIAQDLRVLNLKRQAAKHYEQLGMFIVFAFANHFSILFVEASQLLMSKPG